MVSNSFPQRLPHEAFEIPSLPSFLLTVDGQKIDTALDTWSARSVRGGGRLYAIHWSNTQAQAAMERHFTNHAWSIVKLYIADRFCRKNAGTVHGDFQVFLAFERWIVGIDGQGNFEWSDYNEALARAYLAHGVEHTASKGKRFSLLRSFYRWGVARQLPGFSSSLLLTLESIKAAGNLKGHHVRFRDPVNGPFSPNEKRLIKKALDATKGTPEDRCVVMLHYELGVNPAVIPRLKNGDLIRYEVNTSVFYHLDVPRVKKRTTERETKRRPISTTLGELLGSLMQGDSNALLYHWLSFNAPQDSIFRAMHRFAEAADLLSSQTKKRLKLIPRRFRYTLATHMAEEGASNLHIAEILDHTDLQNVGVYTETTSLITEPVAQATDKLLTPLVQRFLGNIVEPAHLQAFNGSPNRVIPGVTSHIPHIPLNVGGVGMCGRDLRRDGLCKLFPPLSCYLCPSFAALNNGPHQTMLQSLEAYLQDHQDSLDTRILRQLEEVLAAIGEVVAQIKYANKERGER